MRTAEIERNTKETKIRLVLNLDGSGAGEIDTGIGGRTAQMVAERIARVAAQRQVLCITHLPQIACMADVHYYLEKTAKDGKTSTDVRALPPKERAKEIARMASGADATEASLTNAKEMIARAAETKKKLRKP